MRDGPVEKPAEQIVAFLETSALAAGFGQAMPATRRAA
ncbi:hypothetical protein ED21_29321 [Erythrobacter sp. SD-21]|nr:hypothetical protein ED21_29321 [Erythrobacter sp. SD-21]